MEIAIFGAAGPTGVWACQSALDAGHRVRAVSRRTDPLPLDPDPCLTQVRADAISGAGVREAVTGVDGVLSTLGSPYTRRTVAVYSLGTQNIVDGLRTVARGRRLVVISSGLTYPPPPGMGFIPDRVVFPLLRNVLGRTLYADMRRMEDELRADADDVAWTIMRPGRLIEAPTGSAYRLDLDHPTQPYTARADLAAAMVAELDPAAAHLHRTVAPTTTRP